MEILFLVHRIPYPPNKGDKIRSFNELKYLSKDNNIYLGTTLDKQSDEKYITDLKQYCKDIYSVCPNKKIKFIMNVFCKSSFSVCHFYDKSLQAYVNNTLKNKKIDVVICFCSTMAEYIFKSPLFIKGKINGIKLIMDYVDLDSDKWLQYSKYTSFPFYLIYKTENERLFKYEKKINKYFDCSIFVSKREVNVFTKLYPEAKNIHVIPNGVDIDYFTPKQTINNSQTVTRNLQPILVFTGVMDYFANEDGVVWFCNSIYPRIKEKIPETQFYIVGNRPTRKVRKLANIDGVKVTGFVEDIRNYYWMADVCIIPLRIARGLQNKVLEAMATGNAVVATSNARDGIVSSEDIDIMIADDAETFAKKVILLLEDENERKRLAKNAVENIRKNYSWEENLKAFDILLKD